MYKNNKRHCRLFQFGGSGSQEDHNSQQLDDISQNKYVLTSNLLETGAKVTSHVGSLANFLSGVQVWYFGCCHLILFFEITSESI